MYSYPVSFAIYGRDPDNVLVNSDGSTFETAGTFAGTVAMFTQMTTNSPLFTGAAPSFGAVGAMGSSEMGQMPKVPSFQEITPGPDGSPIGSIISENYDLLAGQWPSSAEQLVLIVDQNNEVPTSILYTLGLLPSEDYKAILEALDAGETPDFPDQHWDFDDLVGHQFKMLTAADYYQEVGEGTFERIVGDEEIETLVNDKAMDLGIAGIIRPMEASTDNPLSGTVGYTNLLTRYIVDHTDHSPVVQAQKAAPDINVLTGVPFSTDTEDEKVADAVAYLKSRSVPEKAAVARTLMLAAAAEGQAVGTDEAGMGPGGMPGTLPGTEGQGAIEDDPTGEGAQAAWLDSYLSGDPNTDFLLNVFDTQISGGTYDSNLSDFGVVDMNAPSSINLYADSFEDKDGITESITEYNQTADIENQIKYTDFVGLLMSTVTTVINVISYVLIAFVAVSLIVSSIMIGIITFISVLERTKEISILRSMGASKRNISEVFNAETLIIGARSGLLGVGVTLLLLLPINWAIHHFTGITDVSASLPWVAGVALVVLSMLLTLIAGVIPSRVAANKDPVLALRSEWPCGCYAAGAKSGRLGIDGSARGG